MKNKSLTLIELLIVIAVLALLAAIAVPSFMNAQQRSKANHIAKSNGFLIPPGISVLAPAEILEWVEAKTNRVESYRSRFERGNEFPLRSTLDTFSTPVSPLVGANIMPEAPLPPLPQKYPSLLVKPDGAELTIPALYTGVVTVVGWNGVLLRPY